MKAEAEIIKRNGKRFVVVPEAEYRRLKRLEDKGLPPLPEPDEHGNRPAVEFATVSIARKIIRQRRKLGLSQRELARRAGVRAETINRLEAAKHVPGLATIDKIDRALKAAEQQAKRKRKAD